MEQGRKISGRVIAKMTGCSRNTVRHHADLWLQCGSGDLEPGGSKDLLVFDRLNEHEIQEVKSSNIVVLFQNLEPKFSEVFSKEIRIVEAIVDHFPPGCSKRDLEVAFQNDLEDCEIDLQMGLVQAVRENLFWNKLEGCPVVADREIDSRIWYFDRRRSRSPPADLE